MSGRKTFLDDAYGLTGAAETQAFYDAWSDSYDDEIVAAGYATPTRAAKALAGWSSDMSAPLLDLGCGTGVSGLAFRTAGFRVIDGCDLSPGMLEKARAKGLYRRLISADLSDPIPVGEGVYTQIAAVGVLNPGHAPADALDGIVAKLPPGGLFVFSLNDHARADRSYEGRLMELVDTGTVRLLVRDYGDHLPKIGLQSMIYVLRKT